jgi:hypothetical protein
MAMSDNSEPLNLTVPKKTKEFLQYLSDRQLTNKGTTPIGIATFIVQAEVDKMMKRDAFALYWRQGVGPKPDLK